MPTPFTSLSEVWLNWLEAVNTRCEPLSNPVNSLPEAASNLSIPASSLVDVPSNDLTNASLI